ncbi:Ketosteroid isomerase homolog [Agrococcus baldri]|uniref:Ketosteroid isomerase homolog n=1 Tax=Agrococcus baldri TaxID=153730 RepID=A0AA94KZF6_9MICO|nr:nuclear transport factor 2 family protein [Agrococcus baldri]SFS09860.1 Ketosteroid isomerase homolog [Agrococcus baldri]
MDERGEGRMHPGEVVRSLHRAVSAHDLEGIVAHFAEDYVLENPVHPERSFRGAEQVRRNWSHLLAFIAGLELEERRSMADGSTVWTEIVIRGRLADGTEQVLRGVMIFRVDGGLIAAGTFYLEPVVRDGLDANAALHALTAEPGR